jgi:hypothetical protein
MAVKADGTGDPPPKGAPKRARSKEESSVSLSMG